MEMIYAPIPGTWYASGGVWWKLTSEQRGALASLCIAVAFCRHEVEVKGRKIVLEKGQMVTSVRKMAELVGMTEMKVRTLIKVLKDNNIITFVSETLHTTQQVTQYSLLTIRELHDCTTQQVTQDNIKDIQKNNKEKNNNKKESSEKPFVPPTADEVQQYLNQRGITAFTGEELVNFYEQGGWVYGPSHTPVKSWKACVNTWAKKLNSQKGSLFPAIINNNQGNNGYSTTNIYNNGIAGREERLRRFAEYAAARLNSTEPEPTADELFDF